MINTDGEYDSGEHDIEMPSLRPRVDAADSGSAEAVPKLQTDKMGSARSGCVCFIETEDGQFVKIGYSINATKLHKVRESPRS